MTTVTPKSCAKQARELEALLAQKTELEARIAPAWQALRMSRLVLIKAGEDPGGLPQLLGIDPLQRQGQERAEAVARANAETDRSPAHQQALRNLNAA